MKVLFKNTTKYTKENCNNFIEFHKKKYGKKELFKMVLVFLLVLYIIIFLSLLIAINLFFNKLDIKYDMTKEKIYMLSDQTKKIINNLDQKINIYILASPSEKNSSKEASFINNISSQYKSKNIAIKYKDPEKNPDFINKYKQDQDQKIFDNSIIVQSQKKYKLIEPDKLFSYDYSFDYETFSQKAELKNINVEPEISNAISYVISDYTPKIYKLIGHGENDLNENYKRQIESSNYEIQDLNLITSQKIPDDCKILFMTTPEKDFTSQEVELINNFLDSGSAIIFMNIVNKDLPNLKSLTKKYGFEFNNFILIENNANNYIANNNFYLLPNYTENNICQTLEAKNYKLLIPYGQNIFIDQAQKDNIQSLLLTSNNSYAKNSQNNNLNKIQKEKNDPTGPLDLAIYYINNKTKIIAVGSESILDDETNKYIGGTNLDFIISSINNLNDEAKNIYIAPKDYGVSRVNFTQNQANIIAITSSFIFPAIIFISGILILKSRKSKN